MTTLLGPTGTLLGARVRLLDGTPGEVWSLAQRRVGDGRERVWVAVGSDPPHAVNAAVDELRPAQDDQPTLLEEETTA